MKLLRSLLGRRDPVDVVLYTRPGCHLCDDVKRELAASRLAGEFSLREVDIDADDELAERFGRSIPVLEIGGRTAFKGRVTRDEFERKFARLRKEGR